jgi:hypothetical protein
VFYNKIEWEIYDWDLVNTLTVIFDTRFQQREAMDDRLPLHHHPDASVELKYI